MSLAKPNALAESTGQSRIGVHLRSISLAPTPNQYYHWTCLMRRTDIIHSQPLHRTTMTLGRTFLHARTTKAASRTPQRPTQIKSTEPPTSKEAICLFEISPKANNSYPPNLTSVATARGRGCFALPPLNTRETLAQLSFPPHLFRP